MGDRTLTAEQYKEKHAVRCRRYIYSDYKRTKVLYLSTTISPLTIYKDDRTDDKDKDKEEKGKKI